MSDLYDRAMQGMVILRNRRRVNPPCMKHLKSSKIRGLLDNKDNIVILDEHDEDIFGSTTIDILHEEF